ncbi:hypothetical protein LTR85_012049 [Meristemomyces frigidus]|nr:hypothetical protein LTR85_012049 [Meristemomyces frigidus]
MKEEEATADIRDEVISLYKSRRIEQEGLLQERSLEATLVDIIPRLPKLAKITFARQPRVADWLVAAGRSEQAYNIEVGWRWTGQRLHHSRMTLSGQTLPWEPPKGRSHREVLINGFLDSAKHSGIPQQQEFDNPIIVLKALGAMNGEARPRSIELDFRDVPTSILNDAYAEFEANHVDLLHSAMAHVTAIRLSHYDQYPSLNQELQHREQVFADRWQTLFAKAKRLKSMHFAYGELKPYRAAVSAAFCTQQTWSQLESLWVCLPCSWHLDDHHLEYHPMYGYHDRSLVAFLKRHRKTLKDIKFVNAVGIDPVSKRQTTASLQTTLDFMKTELLELQTARVAIVLETFNMDARDAEARPNWRELDHKLAADSELGQLARSLHIERSIHYPDVDRTSEVQERDDVTPWQFIPWQPG